MESCKLFPHIRTISVPRLYKLDRNRSQCISCCTKQPTDPSQHETGKHSLLKFLLEFKLITIHISSRLCQLLAYTYTPTTFS